MSKHRAKKPTSSARVGVVAVGSTGLAVGAALLFPSISQASTGGGGDSSAVSTGDATSSSGVPHFNAEGDGLPNGGNFTETLPSGAIVTGKQETNVVVTPNIELTDESVVIDNEQTAQVKSIIKSVETNPSEPGTQPLYETEVVKNNDVTGAETNDMYLTTLNAPSSNGTLSGSTNIDKQSVAGTYEQNQVDEDITDNWSKSTSTKTLLNGATETETTRTNDFVANPGGPTVSVADPSGPAAGTDITTTDKTIDNTKTDTTTTIDTKDVTNPNKTQSDTTTINRDNTSTGATSQTNITTTASAANSWGISTGSSTIDKTSDSSGNPADAKTTEDITVGWVDIDGLKIPTSIEPAATPGASAASASAAPTPATSAATASANSPAAKTNSTVVTNSNTNSTAIRGPLASSKPTGSAAAKSPNASRPAAEEFHNIGANTDHHKNK